MILTYLFIFLNILSVFSKKLIIIRPGGLKGFQTLGISSYIKKNYNLEECIYSGASSGAWNALFMCFKGEDQEFLDKVFTIGHQKNVLGLETKIKDLLLSSYDDSDFDLDKLNIGISVLTKYGFKLKIVSEFDDLEDAINACMASSHIPLVTGGLFKVYKKRIVLDGGWFPYPFLKTMEPQLDIFPEMWENTSKVRKKESLLQIILKLLQINKTSFKQYFERGYNDADLNKFLLDKTFK
tara:strand:- start:285 stop:1001 length:717 start_codon:yes stop_codon:yes gene_type:complete